MLNPPSEPSDTNPVSTGLEPPQLPPTQPPVQPPPPQPRSEPGDFSGEDNTATPRPWWGLGDIFLAAVVILVFSTVVALPFVIYEELQRTDSPSDGLTGSPSLPALGIITGLFAQQLAMGVWPIWVAKWKGFGANHDFGFSFRPVDVVLGLSSGVALLILSAVVGAVTSALVGLENPDEASNTALLTDNRDSPLLYLVIFAVVIGAPLSEELFFRGLLLRSVEKRWNVHAGVVVSTIAFTAVHFTGASLVATTVLFASVATLGIGLALLSVTTNRLGAPIVAHATINGVAVLVGLLT